MADTHDPLGGTRASRDVRNSLRQQHGRGRALPDGLAKAVSEHLGEDLSGVRVHTDHDADQLARSVRSTAFTFGSDIYFTRGTYAPNSVSGQHLLAHELAHVAQHRSGRFRSSSAGGGTPLIGRADDPAELDAEQVATGVVSALRRQAGRISSRAQLATTACGKE